MYESAAMQRLLAAFLLLALAACAGPREEVVRAPGEGIAEVVPGSRGAAAREIPSGRRLLADYLLVDKSERLLIAYSGGQPIRAYRNLAFGDAPTGHKRFEGDERTPEGLYTIDWRNPDSRYHLSLHISYPNAEDRARAARFGRSPGGDIFIHGQPTGYPGPPLPGDWTDGCIALSNAEIEELWRLVPDGTPIEIRP